MLLNLLGYYVIGICAVILEYVSSSDLEDTIAELPDTPFPAVVFALFVVLPWIWPIIVLIWLFTLLNKIKRIIKL